MRKEETSWASCGLKGVGEKVSEGVVDGESCVAVGVDLRPVSLSQIDILADAQRCIGAVD